MSDLQRAIDKAASLPEAIGADLDHFGGYLRCRSCGRSKTMQRGDAGFFLRHGWPKCCNGHTMEWITQGQIERGERPPHNAASESQ